METFMNLAERRYSCRKLSDKPVSQELMDQIVASAVAAPTAVNKQPFRLWVMKSPQAKAAIHQVTDYTFGADNFIVVGARSDSAWTRSYDQHCFAEVDASIVATHMMLQIFDLGLATTWVGRFDAPLLKTLCPQMEGYELIAIFPIGYAAEDAQPGPSHTLRKSAEQLTETL